MATVACRHDGEIHVSGIATVSDVRKKMSAFRALFDAEPALLVASGYFICAKSGEPVHLSYNHRVTHITRTRLHVDLGSEGIVHLAGDLSAIRFVIRPTA